MKKEFLFASLAGLGIAANAELVLNRGHKELLAALSSGVVSLDLSESPRIDDETLTLIEVLNRNPSLKIHTPVLRIKGNKVDVINPEELDRAISINVTATSAK